MLVTMDLSASSRRLCAQVHRRTSGALRVVMFGSAHRLLARGAFRFLCGLSAMRREPTHRAGCEPTECDESRTCRHVGLLENFLPQLHRGDTRHACDQAHDNRVRARRSDGRVLLPDLQAMACVITSPVRRAESRFADLRPPRPQRGGTLAPVDGSAPPAKRRCAAGTC